MSDATFTVPGTAQVGKVLSAAPAFTYQWFRSGTAISGATSSSYTLVAADIGTTITANRIDSSLATGVVAGVPVPNNTVLPAVSGTAQVGQTLTASTGTWTNSPTSFTCQWKRAGTPIGGATGLTYVTGSADVGGTLTISVTATNGSGSSTPATSPATSAVIDIAPTINVAASITGTPQVGTSKTATDATWNNSVTSRVYQWKSAGANATGPGATTLTYTPVAGDLSKTLTVTVTASNTGGASIPSTGSPSAAVIDIIPTNIALPTVSGIAQVGQTLTATLGAWSHSPTSYAYNWANSNGLIPGATQVTYVPTSADVGLILEVFVVATNSGGTSAAAASAPTAAVIDLIPTNSAVPTISGTAMAGQTLTATTGTWTHNPTSFTYQWNSAGGAISGATASTYVPVTGDIGNTLTASVVATNTVGSSSAATSAATAAVVAASAYADGSGQAPAGTPQYPTLLNGYVSRPPWKVAGVDYHVGIPAGTTLTDWQAINNPNVFLNLSTNMVTVSGTYTFNNVDFSLHGGAFVYTNTTGITVTFMNCKFANTTSTYSILDQGAAVIIITNCEFNGINMPNMAGFVGYRGNVTSTYSRYINTKQHIFEWLRTSVFTGLATSTLKYNIFDNASPASGAHPNYLQTTNSASADNTVNIAFNLTYQFLYLTPGGEGFQISPAPGLTFTNPVVSNNTMIAKMDGANVTKSYLIDGSAANPVTGGQNNQNYFDITGAFGAYYPGSMTPAAGWSSSGNINMIDGTIITPS